MGIKPRLAIITGVVAGMLITTALFFTRQPPEPMCHTLKDGENTVRVWLEKKSDSLYFIHAVTFSRGQELISTTWKLAYPVYQFEYGDVNGDRIAEIMVGVIKTTRFDSVRRKRLFIFKLFDGYIRPLWLGSRVGQPLEDFRLEVNGGKSIIRTVELEASGLYLVAEYEWRSFGLQFKRYLKREISRGSANKLLTR